MLSLTPKKLTRKKKDIFKSTLARINKTAAAAGVFTFPVKYCASQSKLFASRVGCAKTARSTLPRPHARVIESMFMLPNARGP